MVVEMIEIGTKINSNPTSRKSKRNRSKIERKLIAKSNSQVMKTTKGENLVGNQSKS